MCDHVFDSFDGMLQSNMKSYACAQHSTAFVAGVIFTVGVMCCIRAKSNALALPVHENRNGYRRVGEACD